VINGFKLCCRFAFGTKIHYLGDTLRFYIAVNFGPISVDVVLILVVIGLLSFPFSLYRQWRGTMRVDPILRRRKVLAGLVSICWTHFWGSSDCPVVIDRKDRKSRSFSLWLRRYPTYYDLVPRIRYGL